MHESSPVRNDASLPSCSRVVAAGRSAELQYVDVGESDGWFEAECKHPECKHPCDSMGPV